LGKTAVINISPKSIDSLFLFYAGSQLSTIEQNKNKQLVHHRGAQATLDTISFLKNAIKQLYSHSI